MRAAAAADCDRHRNGETPLPAEDELYYGPGGDTCRLCNLCVTNGHLRHMRDMNPVVVVFDHANVTDAQLAALEQLPRCTDLFLHGEKIGDPALEHVARMPMLRTLSLEGTLVTDAGLAAPETVGEA